MVKNHRLINYTSSDRRYSLLKQSTPEKIKKIYPKLYSKIDRTKKRKNSKRELSKEKKFNL